MNMYTLPFWKADTGILCQTTQVHKYKPRFKQPSISRYICTFNGRCIQNGQGEFVMFYKYNSLWSRAVQPS